MFRNMVTSFLTHERIITTDAKAKELRPIAEKMITLGKKGDLHAIRQASSYIRDKKTVTKLFNSIAPRYKDRAGGYTRIVKLGIRPGDTAPVSVIELVEEAFEKKVSAKKEKKLTAPVVNVQAEQESAVVSSSDQSAEIDQVSEQSVDQETDH
jgi:large subunit ribosomal protein L17